MRKYDEKWALKQAVKAAMKSPCQSKRGVIIWSRISGKISIGWNEPPKPFKCDGSDKCKSECSKTAVHAEQAALMKIPRVKNPQWIRIYEMLHVKVVDGKAVISEKPSCWQCSKLILASELEYMWLYLKEGLVRYSPADFHEQTLKNNDLNYIL